MTGLHGIFLSGLILAGLVIACEPKIDTGRNGDPGSWPTAPSGDNQTAPVGGLKSTCFLTPAEKTPDEIKKLCDEDLASMAELSELRSILCEAGYLLNAIDKPQCGWDGNLDTSKNRFIHRYFTQSDKSKDYEDVTSSVIRVPVTLTTYTEIIRLAFENFDEFTRRGYQWASGTRENRNLSQNSWQDGLSYRFRADKDVYEVGYEGHIRYYQLTPSLGIHVNRAVGDFERIKKFAQIIIYNQLEDDSTLIIRLEHRQIQSSGLFDLAKKSALELDFEAMEKGHANATKK
jgi:hypothetical protein